MQTYIAILRGINVSGHKLIKMELLRTMFNNMKFKNVETYIQSGNVIFQTARTKCTDLEKKIAKKIVAELKFEVPVLVKTLQEMIEVVENNPFIGKGQVDETKLHITFLSQEPEKNNVDKIAGEVYTHDKFVLAEKTVYLLCPDGYGNTKLNNTFFEKKLNVTATTRSWKTTKELLRITENYSNNITKKTIT